MEGYRTLDLTEQETIASIDLQWPDAGTLSRTLLSDCSRLQEYFQ